MSIMSLDAATGRTLADTPIREEIVNSFELGWKTELANGDVRLNGAIFYNDYKDQQINQFVNGEFVVLNADSETYGAEVELNYASPDGFFVDGSASILQTNVKNPQNLPELGQELPSAPELTFSLAARKEWEFDSGAVFTLGASGNYVSDRFFDLANATSDSSYFVTNAQASLEFGEFNEFQISLWGKNIFNETYFLNRFSNTSGLGPDTVLLSEPATYGVTFRYEY